MKVAVLLVGLLAIALASPVKVKLMKQQNLIQGTKEFLQVQRIILRLFRNINQPNYYKDQVNIAENYDIEDSIDSYTNPQVVREFMDLNRLGFLPKDETFSIFNEQHRREAISLFKVLYYAKDYTTMYRTACWARVFMNEGLFIYSLSVAIVQRPDTAMMELPAIYEIHPEYFYNNEVIEKAQEAVQQYQSVSKDLVEENMGSMQEPVREDFEEELTQKPMEGEGWRYPINENYLNAPLQEPDQELQERMLPSWHNLLPVAMRTQKNWLEQWRGTPVTSEQFRMGQLQKEQITQMQLREKQLKQERMRQDQLETKQGKFMGVTVDANYSRTVMSYFTEDVGLNAYYYYHNIYFPFWLPSEMINFQTQTRGEQFYYSIQQLLARYYLERLSNGLGEVPIIDYMDPIQTGHYPSMLYPSGMKPELPWMTTERVGENVQIDSNYTNSYMFVRDYERRIRDAIDLGYVFTNNGKLVYLYDARGFETLGNMVEGNPESPNARFYGSLQIFARLLLGNSQRSTEEYKVTPSALEQFETSLRDPVFYQFYKRMLMYFQRYLNNVPPYSTKQLLMSGVKIVDVKVDPLITYFDYHYSDITNAVYNRTAEESYMEIPVRVKQLRLNNKPFNYEMHVISDRRYDGLIKVFLGPKHDEKGNRLDAVQNRLNFVAIDKFQVLINPGYNNIRRNSSYSFYSTDRTTYMELYGRIMMDMNRPGMSEYVPRAPEWGMPKRLLLPKGTTDGTMYQMYFIIMPYQPMEEMDSEMPSMNYGEMMDKYPLGYPFDRPIDESVFYVPNSFFKDVMIYNRNISYMEDTKF